MGFRQAAFSPPLHIQTSTLLFNSLFIYFFLGFNASMSISICVPKGLGATKASDVIVD